MAHAVRTHADPPSHRHDQCRVYTNANASAEWYRWRNAYYRDAAGNFVTMEYGVCEGGQGPWAWGASGVTVQECMDKARYDGPFLWFFTDLLSSIIVRTVQTLTFYMII